MIECATGDRNVCSSYIRTLRTAVLSLTMFLFVVRDSSVGTATRYGLDGPGIESRWGRDFQQPSRPTLEPTQPPVQWVSGLFPGGETAGAWR